MNKNLLSTTAGHYNCEVSAAVK